MINCYSIIVPINAYPCALSGVQQINKKKVKGDLDNKKVIKALLKIKSKEEPKISY